jgi:hypothetical protein
MPKPTTSGRAPPQPKAGLFFGAACRMLVTVRSQHPYGFGGRPFGGGLDYF